jgi:membrane protease YdiL (CAAX protease family)
MDIELQRAPATPPASPPPPALDPLRAGRALVFFVAYLAAQLLVGLVAGVVAVVAGVPPRSPWIFLIAVFAGVLAGAWLVLALARRWNPHAEGPLATLDIGWSAGTRRQRLLAGGAGVLLGVLAVLFLVWAARDGAVPDTQLTQPALRRGFAFLAWAIFEVALAPLVEEPLFRGLMLRGLSRSWGPFAAGLSVTVLFVGMHVQQTGAYLPALVAIAGLGCATLAARTITDSLGPAVALHIGYNIVIVLATALASA